MAANDRAAAPGKSGGSTGSEGLMRVALDHGVPVANGVLAVEQFEDARARAGGAHGNKGEEAAFVVLEMANLLGRLA